MLLHAAALLAGIALLPESRGPGPDPDPEPLVLNLVPEEEPMVRQVVETVTTSDAPPEDARLIARENTVAADTELRDGDQDGPMAEQAYPVETLARRESAPTPQPVAATPEPMPTPEPAAPKPQPATPAPPIPDVPTVAAAKPAPEMPAKPEPAERMQVAQAKPVPPQARPESPSRSRGDLNNRVMNKGFASYEAIQDEAAAYLEQVKRKVEKEWREALLLRYSGTLPRVVDVDCEISSDGRLVSVKHATPPEDRIFGAICLDAIRRAGPFPPFPFQVPEIYRNQNLEIRWHFSFL